MKNYLNFVGVLLFISLFSGCSKDRNILVKTSESDRNSPSVALVRRVDLSYRAPDGKEKFTQSISVLGLNSPVSLESKNIENFEIETGGAFFAVAKSAEGSILLQGSTWVQENGQTVEVELNRNSQNQATSNSVNSAWLSSIRFSLQAGSEQDYALRTELFEAKKAGRCIEIPKIKIAPDGWFSPFIRLVPLQGLVAPDISAVFKDQKGNEIGKIQKLAFNQMGDPLLVFNKDLLGGYFFNGSHITDVYFYSKDDEGCVRLNTEFQAQDLKLNLSLLDGANKNKSILPIYLENWLNNKQVLYPSESLDIENPNPFDIKVVLSIDIKNSENKGRDQLCVSDRPIAFDEVSCFFDYSYPYDLKSFERKSIGIVGSRAVLPTIDNDFIHSESYKNHPLRMYFLNYTFSGSYKVLDKDGKLLNEKSFKLK